MDASGTRSNWGITYVIGVSGHRDIPERDVAAVSASVSEVLSGIRDQMPDVRLEVVTGLATGADTIAAKAALNLGIPIRAVLPMPLDLYRSDFTDSQLMDLEALLAAPGLVYEEIPVPGDPTELVGLARDEAYVRLSDYLARRSNFRLVLWNGDTTLDSGGTADTLARFLGALRLPSTPMLPEADSSANGTATDLVALWIPVRRTLDEPRPDPALLFIVSASDPVLLSVVNAPPSSERVKREEMQSRAKSFHTLKAEQVSRPLSEGAIAETSVMESRLQEMNATYVEADSLAVRYGKLSTRMFLWLAIIAGAMGFFFLVYAKVSTTPPYIVAYLVLVIAAIILSRIASNRAWLVHYLVNRATAETARIRYFFGRAGIGDVSVADRLLRLTGVGALAGFDLLRDSLKSGQPLSHLIERPTEEQVSSIRNDWISDQAGYLASKVAALGRRERQLKLTRVALFGLSVIAAIVLLFFSKQLADVHVTQDLKAKTVLIFLMGLLPLLLALWELYQYKLASQELHWQFENQALQFRVAGDRLAAADSWEEQRNILDELEEQSLFEVYLWVIHRYHREIEPTLPG
jgi:hypothetical protein